MAVEKGNDPPWSTQKFHHPKQIATRNGFKKLLYITIFGGINIHKPTKPTKPTILWVLTHSHMKQFRQGRQGHP